MSHRSWPWSLPLWKKHLGRTNSRQRSVAGRRGRGLTGGVRAAAPFCSEGLEPRFMLTTLVGGQSFVYVDNSLPGDVESGQGELVRVRVDGNIRVEIVGAAVSGRNNQAEITN